MANERRSDILDCVGRRIHGGRREKTFCSPLIGKQRFDFLLQRGIAGSTPAPETRLVRTR